MNYLIGGVLFIAILVCGWSFVAHSLAENGGEWVDCGWQRCPLCRRRRPGEDSDQ